MKSVMHWSTSTLAGGHQGSFCMLCVMQNHIVQAFANSGNAIKPVSFIRDLKKIARHFRFGNQEDAHEFLRYTIDAMQKACLNDCAKYVLPHPPSRGLWTPFYTVAAAFLWRQPARLLSTQAALG
ncbi:hypothetical protein P7K49_011945 [Saguinus oedipus]|uniref:Peptidase C19 ubiquitin carboxyl-terminal hydrolase domain-containing protein n=1 Tax=Saguinus oedipus TaxID=9490 RepID=A0ABQ9VS39_SAGOE|nr:hypothetical protein P7K49_011945 [Saguinus oedipus]